MSQSFRERVPLSGQLQRWRAFAEAAERAANACGAAGERDAVFHLGNARRRAQPFRFPVEPNHAQAMARAIMELTLGWGDVMPEERARLAPTLRELARWCFGALTEGSVALAVAHRERLGLD